MSTRELQSRSISFFFFYIRLDVECARVEIELFPAMLLCM